MLLRKSRVTVSLELWDPATLELTVRLCYALVATCTQLTHTPTFLPSYIIPSAAAVLLVFLQLQLLQGAEGRLP